MYLVGLFFYITIALLMVFFEPAYKFIAETYALSPEITTLIVIAYFYPLAVFFLSMIFRKREFANINYFKSQVHLASTLAVSFGLIGTFIGLAEMIAGIAAGLAADGDFSEKMTALLLAIGTALDSMSYAFLTSILGIGASVAILFASNFLMSFFIQEAGPNKKGKSDDGEGYIVPEGIQRIEDRVDSTIQVLENKEKMWSDLYLLLEGNSGSAVVKNLMGVLQSNNDINAQLATEIKDLKEDNIRTNLENTQRIQLFGERIVEMLSTVNQSTLRLAEDSNTNTDRIVTSSNEQMRQLSSVAGILNDLRIALAVPMKESLKEALVTNALELSYQPEKDKNGKIVGAEALLKWVDPTRGHVNNGELFAVAKENGLLVDVDKWVMKTAINQIADWTKLGKWNSDWNLSINLSADFLVDPSMVSYLDSLISKHNIKPDNFGIEVTEDTIMDNNAVSKDKIRQINSLGVKTYIDDFGTGFMSVVNLKELKIDRLKIDRSILKGFLDGSEDDSVIQSIIYMAKELNIEAAAEAIETQADLTKLVDVGCDVFQGYFLGKPCSADEFIDSVVEKVISLDREEGQPTIKV